MSFPRRLVLPGIVAGVAFAILVGLGVWQLERREWKRGILGAIDRAEASPSIDLPGTPPLFEKVRVTGRLDGSKVAYYGADLGFTLSGQQLGAHLIVPLLRAQGDPVLIDRGWVPLERPVDLPPPPDPVTVEGFVRTPERPGWFAPADDPAAKRFYTLDPARIGAALGLSHVAPLTLVALGAKQPGVFPQPATTLPRPPNDHLNYAMTWFALALSLLLVFGFFARKVLRS